MKGNKRNSPVLIKGERLKAKSTFFLYTNAGYGKYGSKGYGIKTFSKSKLDKEERRLEKEHVQLQIHSSREIPQISKKFEFDGTISSFINPKK